MIFAMEPAWLFCVALCLGCGAADDDAVSARPNIVLIVSDYMSYGDTQPYGAPDVATPSLDRLATQGVRFTDFHSAAPICGPSRASLLTGLSPARAGIEQNVEADDPGLAPDRITLARRLRDAGYDTALIGKWHLGTGDSGPVAHGFDRFLGFHEWTLDYYDHTTPQGEPGLWEGEQPVTREGYLTDVLTDEAVDYVSTPRDRPFFLYLAYNTALPPYQPPRLSPEQRAGRWEKASRKDYAAMIQSMDAGIGRVLQALDARGLTDDTLVVFTTDHGGGPIARPAPHSEGFLSLHEGGIRVPLLLRWPGTLPADEVSTRLGISMDLTATLLDAAGVELPADAPLDGETLLPVAGSTDAEPAATGSDPGRTLYWRFATRRGAGTRSLACRRGRWKFLVEITPEGVARAQLFDLTADPAETTDLSAAQPALRAELAQALQDWDESQPPTR